MKKYITAGRREQPRKYRGCNIADAGDVYVCTNQYGTTIGQSQTVSGCEGLIDEYLDYKVRNVSPIDDYRKVSLFDSIIRQTINSCNPDAQELIDRLTAYGLTDDEINYIIETSKNAYYAK